jgi:hypothetical protein
LSIAKDVAFTAQFKIDGGKFETISRGGDRLNPGPGRGVWFTGSDEQAHTSVLASTNPPAQLV